MEYDCNFQCDTRDEEKKNDFEFMPILSLLLERTLSTIVPDWESAEL